MGFVTVLLDGHCDMTESHCSTSVQSVGFSHPSFHSALIALTRASRPLRIQICAHVSLYFSCVLILDSFSHSSIGSSCLEHFFFTSTLTTSLSRSSSYYSLVSTIHLCRLELGLSHFDEEVMRESFGDKKYIKI